MRRVEIVGILNLDPQSFSGDGLTAEPDIAHSVSQMFVDGASYIDVGAESTRPDATPLSLKEEWERLRRPLRYLLETYPGKISLDTYKPGIIKRAQRYGQVVINDITGFKNSDMVELAATSHATCIVSHLPANDAQSAHAMDNKIDSVDQVASELLATCDTLEEHGVHRGQIVLDPGIGFGKTHALSSQLLEFALEVPMYSVMVGYSKKRFLGEGRYSKEVNLEAGRIAINSGAHYLRLHHDLIKSHKQLLF